MSQSHDFEIRLAFFALLTASVAILAAAFAFQLFGGLRPCELCLWQRYPYGVVIGLAGVGLGLTRAGVAQRPLVIVLAVCALVLLIGAGIAVFHVGVEQTWWQGLTACTGNLAATTTIDDLRQKLLAAPVVRCDEIAWSLFGISMAGYNVLMSGALGIGGLMAAWRLVKQTPQSRPSTRRSS